MSTQETTISIWSAAARLGVSRWTLRSWIRRGHLSGYRDEQGVWRITTDSLRALVHKINSPYLQVSDLKLSEGDHPCA